MEITTKNGLLYRDGQEIPLPEADKVARKHGHQYAEQLVKALEARNLEQELIDYKNIAKRIADELFKNGIGEKAERLVLELENGSNGGGWCKQAVIDIIKTNLIVMNDKGK